MDASSDYSKKIEHLARPFVELGIYDSPEKCAKELIAEMAERKIRYYSRAVKSFEAKYGMPFSKFTQKLKGRAKPKQEDDWMEWEAATDMLDAWKKASEELGLGAP